MWPNENLMKMGVELKEIESVFAHGWGTVGLIQNNIYIIYTSLSIRNPYSLIKT